MAEFLWEIRFWPTLAEFESYLATLPPPSWCNGVTIHHTYIPTIAQWRGRSSMVGLGNYYKNEVQNPDGSRGWPAGPQLFIAPEGIWQGTPITRRGVHAGICNASRIGMEVVGNYDPAPWKEPIAGYAYGALAAICRWLKIGPERINGHRDCDSPKTCPGRAIDMGVVRSTVANRLYPPVDLTGGVDIRLIPAWNAAGGTGRKVAGVGHVPGPGLAKMPAIPAPDGNGIIQRCERMFIGLDAAGQPRFPLLSELDAWGLL